MAEMHWSDVMQSLPARAPAGELQGPVLKPKARLAFNAAGLLVPAAVEPSRPEAVAAAPGEPRAAGAACEDIRIEPTAPKRPLEAMKYEPLEKLNAEAAAAAEAAQAEKRARASGSCRILSLKQEERRIKKEAAEQARAAKAARTAAALEHRAARAAAPRAAAGRGPAAEEEPAVAMEEEEAEEEEEDPVDEASDDDALEEELLAEQGPPLQLPLPDPTERMRLHPDARTLQVPGDIHAKLKPYQVEGVAFLHRRWCQRPLRAGEARGCVLGDDMGLGKTCQAIAFLAALMRKRGMELDKRSRMPEGGFACSALIVVPKSLIKNWEIELDMWGAFARCTAYGKQQESAIEAINERRAEVCITSYDVFKRRTRQFNALPVDVVIFDEAHKLQNHKTGISMAAFTTPARAFRLCLTGTIMSNGFSELHTLLDLAMPTSLGTRADFMGYYARGIGLGRRINSTQAEVAEYARLSEMLHRTISTYVLQRLKSDPAIKPQLPQLPQKSDRVVLCQLAPLQQRAYDRFTHFEDIELLSRYDEECDCGSGRKRGRCCHMKCQGPVFLSYDHVICEEKGSCPLCLILPLLTLGQKLANHLELIKADQNEPVKEKLEREAIIARALLGNDEAAAGGVYTTDRLADLASTEHCGKLRTLEILLTKWYADRDKVLLFSYSTRLLNILENFLIARHWTFARLDGSTKHSDRQRLVNNFNRPGSATFVFLISTKAGGVGLNLTAANRVVVFDPSWNPANDLQAQDRAYRIGQTRDVTVYRLVGAHTIEEMVYLRQISKQQTAAVGVRGSLERRLFTGVQNDRNNKGELFGLGNLFKPREGATRVEHIQGREKELIEVYEMVANDLDEDDDDGDDAAAAPGDAAHRLLRAVRRNQRAGGDDEAGASEDDDDGEPDEVALEMKKAGMVHALDHTSMLGQGRVEPNLVLDARAATEGGMRKPRVVGRGAGVAPAPVADIPFDAIALLAAHHNMSAHEMASRLEESDRMMRDTLVETFLASKGLARS